MKRLLIIIITLAACTFNSCNEKPPLKKPDERSNSASSHILTSGLYLAVPDDSKSQGSFRVINTNDYFFLAVGDGFPLINLDTCWIEHYAKYDWYILKLKFNTTGVKELTDFTEKYKNGMLGVVIDNKLRAVTNAANVQDAKVQFVFLSEKEIEMNKLKIEEERARVKRTKAGS